MADTKITGLLSPQVTTNPATDVLPIVNIADTLMASSGSTRKITVNQLLGAGGTATLASATITGALTGQSSGSFYTGTALPFHIRNSGTSLTQLGDNATIGAGTAFVVGSSDGTLRFQCGGNEQYRIASSGVFSWYDGAGGTRMTLNSTGLGIGGSPTTRFEVFSGFIKNTATTGSAQIIAANTGGVFTLAKDSSTGGNFIAPYASVLYSDGPYPVCIFSNGSERMRIDSSGNVISNVTGTAPTLATNSQMVFNLTSNTNLRISVRGTDGTTRVANITLA